jgi:hypothetical protein
MAYAAEREAATLPQTGPTNHTLFESPEWLDAVAPAGWQCATVEESGRIVAALPYVIKSRAGLRVVSVPPLTPWLGPWIALEPGKYETRLAREHVMLRRLISQLPRADVAVIPAAPEQTNLLPFYWEGFDLRVGYTYRIPLDGSLDAIWQSIKQRTRNAIRKSARTLVVNPSEDVDAVMRLIAATYRRQGRAPPRIASTIGRILGSSPLKPHRELLVAQDQAGQTHAFALLAYDSRHTFYVIGGADPALRSSGAQTYLLWCAIERSYGRSAVFDFEGSMKEEIERPFRAFGAVQTAQITAVSEPTILGRLYRLFKPSTGSRDLSGGSSAADAANASQ